MSGFNTKIDLVICPQIRPISIVSDLIPWKEDLEVMMDLSQNAYPSIKFVWVAEIEWFIFENEILAKIFSSWVHP